MIEVVLIGSGNVAFHLHHAIMAAQNVTLKQLAGRDLTSFNSFSKDIPKTIIGNKLSPADVYIVAVSDDAVQDVFEKTNINSGILVHTSGALHLRDQEVFQNTGVFYPLQTFSKSKRVDITNIPLLIEARKKKDIKVLETLALALGMRPISATPKTRLAAHLAAVFANNFTNHMIYLAQEICRSNDLESDILDPVIRETFSKLQFLSARDAQTGPARRGDFSTQNLHKQEMKQEELRKLYALISNSIEKTYEEKL